MDLLQPGQKLSINIEKDNKLVEMVCTINEVFDDRIDIELPQYFMRYVEFLDVGKPLTIKVFSKFGTIDFNTVVISSPLEDKFIVELDYNAIKLTADENLPAVDAILQMKMKKGEEEFFVKTLDISIEKIRLLSETELIVEENYDCELILPKDYGTINFKATVKHKDIIYDNEYNISCYAMSEEDRQTLLYYMYMYTSSFDQ